MKTEQEIKEITKAIRQRNTVRVFHIRMSDDSTCNVKSCKKADKYGLCVGGTQLSNLVHLSCEKHLSLHMEKAIEDSNKETKREVAQLIRDNKKEAKKLLKIS